MENTPYLQSGAGWWVRKIYALNEINRDSLDLSFGRYFTCPVGIFGPFFYELFYGGDRPESAFTPILNVMVHSGTPVAFTSFVFRWAFAPQVTGR